jgi:murein DD-endopeptidase MepM/ murein hydrolase activator NlpD
LTTPLEPKSARLRLRWNRRTALATGLVVGGLIAGAVAWRLTFAPDDQVDADIAQLEKEAMLKAEAEVLAPAPATPTPVATGKVIEGQVAKRQTLPDVLAAAGVTPADSAETIRALTGVFDFRKMRPGDQYRIELGDDGDVHLFFYKSGPVDQFRVVRDESNALKGERVAVEVQREIVEVNGTIENSLFGAFEAAGESANLAMTLSDVFAYDIDFYQETRTGDRFRFFVEKYTSSGELVKYGLVYAAEYVGVPKGPIGRRRLFWYENAKSGVKGYFGDDARAAKRAFLRAPLKITRVTSGFGYRFHPISHKRKFHHGVDYGAPIGTPVMAVADGTVTYVGEQGAAGNMIKLAHGGGFESMYLHLSAMKVRTGQKVDQGHVIGLVGSTGHSTGPHLDFRLKHKGKYVNPHKKVAPRTIELAASERPSFKKTIAEWETKLNPGPSVAAAPGK